MSGDLELSKTIATNALVGADAFDTMALNNLLGALAVMQDDLEGGEAHFREAARVGHGLIDVLQPLTNAAAVAAFRGHRARAAREASLLLPRLERCSWRQNIGWCCLTLWATHEDPDMASSYGDRAREIFERPTTDSQLRLARMAIENLQAAKRPELAGLAERWVDQ